MEEKVMEIEGEIAGYKQLLANSDYQALKYAEGFIDDKDYAEIKAERQALRDKINELEVQELSLTAQNVD